MHIADFSIGMLGADGIVGAGLPIATRRGPGRPAGGRGQRRRRLLRRRRLPGGRVPRGAQSGRHLEAAPALRLREQPLRREHAGLLLAGRRRDHAGCPRPITSRTSQVHGNDVEAVYEAAGEAVDMLRRGEGPLLPGVRDLPLAQALPLRRAGGPAAPEELEAWAKRCPVAAFEAKLLAQDVLTLRRRGAHRRARSCAQVDEAYQFGVESPYPEPEDALEDVYSL